jgi:uncharacterized protein YpuA (DUF1002 family)
MFILDHFLKSPALLAKMSKYKESLKNIDFTKVDSGLEKIDQIMAGNDEVKKQALFKQIKSQFKQNTGEEYSPEELNKLLKMIKNRNSSFSSKLKSVADKIK